MIYESLSNLGPKNISDLLIESKARRALRASQAEEVQKWPILSNLTEKLQVITALQLYHSVFLLIYYHVYYVYFISFDVLYLISSILNLILFYLNRLYFAFLLLIIPECHSSLFFFFFFAHTKRFELPCV